MFMWSSGPLKLLTFAGHVSVIRVLREKGADLNLAPKHGTTPLAAAADNGHDQACVWIGWAVASVWSSYSFNGSWFLSW